jgi:hypothetical protein
VLPLAIIAPEGMNAKGLVLEGKVLTTKNSPACGPPEPPLKNSVVFPKAFILFFSVFALPINVFTSI